MGSNLKCVFIVENTEYPKFWVQNYSSIYLLININSVRLYILNLDVDLSQGFAEKITMLFR